MTRALEDLHAQLASSREDAERVKGEHEAAMATLIAQVRE